MIWHGKNDANGAGQEPNPHCWMLLLPKPWAELPGQKSCSCGAMRWGDVQAPSSGKKPPLWKVRLAQTHGLLGAIGTKKKETNPGMGLVPREYLFSFQFGRESGYNHNRGNKLGLGKKEKSGNLLGFKDLGSLRMYFTLHCSCHIHLERLMCSHCRLHSSPARDPVPAATGRPRKQDQGGLRRKSFCSLGSTPPYQNGVVTTLSHAAAQPLQVLFSPYTQGLTAQGPCWLLECIPSEPGLSHQGQHERSSPSPVRVVQRTLKSYGRETQSHAASATAKVIACDKAVFFWVPRWCQAVSFQFWPRGSKRRVNSGYSSMFYVVQRENACAGLAQIQPTLTFEGQEPDLNSDC